MSTIVTNPVLPQAQNPGDIVDVQLQNNTSSTQPAGEITFGQIFADGDLPAGAQLIALINGQQVAVQMDVKTTNPDGSVRFAVLTVDSPAIAANSHVDVMLAQGTPITAGAAPVQIGNIVSEGYNTTVDLTLHNADGTTSPVHVDVGQLLTSALQSGHYTTWMQGPLATEVQITAPISGSLQAQFNITAYADGKVSTDVVMGSQGSYQADANTDHVYDIAIHSGGQTVFQQSNLDQVAHTTWHEQFWSSGASVAAAPATQPVFDIGYLEKTGAIPTLDTSLGVDSATLDANVTALNASNTGPEGSALITQYMPETGGRSDIGELSTWEANYLETQDPRALQVMMANANAAGSVPWHFNDPATGLPVSIVDHPNVDIFGVSGGTGVDNLDTSPTNTNGFTVDEAHQPELSYIAYLTTGNPYYLQELQTQANFDLLDVNPGYRGGSDGLIDDGHGQLRAEAWDIRELADAAFISPNADPLSAYFTNILNNNLNYLADAYVFGGALSGTGQLQGWIQDYNVGGVEPPWEDDYMATALSQAVRQGFSGASAVVDWMINFEAGRFLNGANGFNPLDGAAFHLDLWNPGTQGAVSVFGPGVMLYSTWAQVFQASVAAGDIPSTPDMNAFTIAEYYPMYARGTMAELFNATGAVDALAAFGVLTGVMNATPDLQTNPKWDFMPQLHDGNILQATQLKVVAGSTGGTFTGTTNDLLIYDSGSGNDAVSGGQGVNVLFAGSGNDTLTAGAKGDYLFGGAGSDQLVGGAGNDTIVAGSGSSTMTGGGGSDTFVLREGGGNVTISDFHSGDVVDLEHYTAQSFASLQAAMTQSGSNVVVQLDAGQTLTLQNHTISDLTAAEFGFSGPVYAGAAAVTAQSSTLPGPSPLGTLQPGTWTEITNSHLASVVYSGPLASSLQGNTGPAAIMNSWSGGTFDAQTDSLIVWGGGHTDYGGNEVYAFSLRTLQWSELSNPSSLAGYDGTGVLADGLPAARHTYDGMTFLPNTGQMFETGGAHWINGGSDNTSWLFNPSTGAWQQTASNASTAGYGDIAEYDPVTQSIFEINSGAGLQQYNPSTNSWKSIGSGTPISDFHMTGAIDPGAHILVATGNGFLNVVDLMTGAVTSPTASGDLTVQNGNAPGFVWDPAANEFVGWNGGSTLYTLDPNTWLWTAHTAAAANVVTPTAAAAAGTFGRFQYDAADNVFLVVNDINQDVFVYKPDFGSAASTGAGSGSTTGGTTGGGSGSGSTTGTGSGGTTGGGTTGAGSGSTTGTGSGSGTGTTPTGPGTTDSAGAPAADPTADLLHHLMPGANALLQALLNSHAQDPGYLASSGHPGFVPFIGTDTAHTTAVHGDWMFHF